MNIIPTQCQDLQNQVENIFKLLHQEPAQGIRFISQC